LFHALNTEPWDTPFGPAALLGVGFVFGYTGRRHPILWSLGILLGQAIAGMAIAMTSRGPNLFLPLGLLFLVPLTLPALIGALAGAGLAKRSLPAGEQ
jgi:hypothetical protein